MESVVSLKINKYILDFIIVRRVLLTEIYFILFISVQWCHYLTKNPTDALIYIYMLIPLNLNVILLHVSARKGPTSRIFTSGHIFCWPCLQNVSLLTEDGPCRAETCRNVTVWIKLILKYRVRINYRRILTNHIFTNTEHKCMMLLPF